ncbi:ankyrin repeat and LEM domain-containing protein 1-like isoform X2 [Dreissena polymorpha]|nr:ankyrin repeat and LEM domain-containing protein 1-like isoform X2 [Dreissena polymorpha]
MRQALSGNLDLSKMPYLERNTFKAFQNPKHDWRDGTLKSSFNYLLLDPRITKNLPNRECNMNKLDVFRTFISAIFYIGKGMRDRPYFHLYEAIKHKKSPTKKASGKVQRILDIWSGGEGVVSLHCFQSVIPVEAYTREACMVDAIGLKHLTNKKRGNYYGKSVHYSEQRRRRMGVYLLKKVLHIFIAEGGTTIFTR